MCFYISLNRCKCIPLFNRYWKHEDSCHNCFDSNSKYIYFCILNKNKLKRKRTVRFIMYLFSQNFTIFCHIVSNRIVWVFLKINKINGFRYYSFPQLNVSIHNTVFVSICLIFYICQMKIKSITNARIISIKQCLHICKYDFLNMNKRIKKQIFHFCRELLNG